MRAAQTMPAYNGLAGACARGNVTGCERPHSRDFLPHVGFGPRSPVVGRGKVGVPTVPVAVAQHVAREPLTAIRA